MIIHPEKSNLHDLLSSVEHKRRHFESQRGWNKQTNKKDSFAILKSYLRYLQLLLQLLLPDQTHKTPTHLRLTDVSANPVLSQCKRIIINVSACVSVLLRMLRASDGTELVHLLQQVAVFPVHRPAPARERLHSTLWSAAPATRPSVTVWNRQDRLSFTSL